MKLNNLESKALASWHHLEKDDAFPAANELLVARIRDAARREDQSIADHLKSDGVEKDELVGMPMRSTEDELAEEIKKDLDEKDADEASKTFESVKAKI